MWRLLVREAGCLVMSLRGVAIDRYSTSRYGVRYEGADWHRKDMNLNLGSLAGSALDCFRTGPTKKA